MPEYPYLGETTIHQGREAIVLNNDALIYLDNGTKVYPA
jgi:hypothetical protein